MSSWMDKFKQPFRYRVTHTSKFPKGDLVSFFQLIHDQGFEPTHIIDVGANRGKWSRKAHGIFPDCKFTLVEPQREMSDELRQFCAEVPGSRWIQAGAGAEPGELPLTVFPDTVSSGFAYSEKQASKLGHQRRMTRIVTLDELVQNEDLPIPEMVKIDAEGFEPLVMKGADSLIGKTEIFLLEASFMPPPENWMSLADILNMMSDYGYELFDFTSFQRINGIMALGEIAFVRENGFLRSRQSAPSKQVA